MTKSENTFEIKFKLQTGGERANKNKNKFIATSKYIENEKTSTKCNGVLNEDEYKDPEVEETESSVDDDFSNAPVILDWFNIFKLILLHLIFLYSLAEIFYWRTAKFKYLAMIVPFGWYTGVSITAGAHRLWAHRTYKATLPLRIFLMIGQTIAMQNSIYVWARDHRTHHKWTETNADPHNAKRGFFFAHMGWLMCKKHPDVKSKVTLVDMADLENDPVVMWQHRNYTWLVYLAFFAVPTLTYSYFFNWSYWHAFTIAGIVRYVLTLHGTWLINSAAHFFGSKPYDKDIHATESLALKMAILGEGYHNYHHVFPWDYKAAEWRGIYFNPTKGLIDVCAMLGLAYDLKTVSADVVKRRVLKKGDGSHPVWGWGDKNIPDEHLEATKIMYRKSD